MNGPDLRTTYLGLALSHPIVASAGPLTSRIDTLRALERAGAAAVVLPSLFEEEIVAAAFAEEGIALQGVGVFGEAYDYLPRLPAAPSLPEQYLELVGLARKELSIPVIASLNGTTSGGWVRFAQDIADAGADALELNVYRLAADIDDSAHGIESDIIDQVSEVRARVGIPLAIKIAPWFTALGSFAHRLAVAGADGLVLFNRFYQPDIDLEEMAVRPSLELSTSADLRLPLRWTAILSGQVHVDLALSGGVHESTDVVKGLLAGANVTMTTSSLLRRGPGHLTVLRDGLASWMRDHDYGSVTEMRGAMAQGSVPDPDAYERANYFQVIRAGSRRYGGALH